jgi:hypothetical protein
MNIYKKFDEWNIQKKVLNSKTRTKTIKERDVFFLSLGENVGSEQSGKGNKFLRPVLVYKKFSHTLFLGIPLTTKIKKRKILCSVQFKRQKKHSYSISN